MLGRLKSVFGKSGSRATAQPPTIETVVRPDVPFYAVGDIHGCDALLQEALGKIEADDREASVTVFLGDYVDRGPQSAQVLERLFKRQSEAPEQTICLMGNHEVMMLEFIDDPIGRGMRWLRNGGVETLSSFGISGAKAKPDAEDAMDWADALEDAMPKGMQSWLRDLPVQWSSGNVHCVHAALDPGRAVSDQKRHAQLWGHRDFMKVPREDGACVIFGHVIVPRPDVRDGRIAIDTGAYKTGRLTVAHVGADGVAFL